MRGRTQRLLMLLLVLALPALFSSRALAQGTLPAPTGLTATTTDANVVLNFAAASGQTKELVRLEDGPTNGNAFGLGAASKMKTLMWINKLTPSKYPATLVSAKVGFITIVGHRDGQMFTLLLFKDPMSQGPQPNQKPDFSMPIAVSLEGQTFNFSTYDVSSAGLTINSGSFMIGVHDNITRLGFPALCAPSLTPPLGTNSYASVDEGASFTEIAQSFPMGVTGLLGGAKASWGLRAEMLVGDPGPPVRGYNIYRSTSTPVAITAANKIATVDPTMLTYADNNVPGGDGTVVFYYAVTAAFDSGESVASNEVTAVPGGSGDFTVALTPAMQSIGAGMTTSFTINTTATGTFNNMLNLTAAVTPADTNIIATITPTTVAVGKTATVTVATTASAPLAGYTLTVTGTSGALVHTATSQVNVVAPDFALKFTPATVDVTRGQKGTLTLTVERLGGFTGNVTVTTPNTKAIKIKITPATQSTSSGNLTYSFKIKKPAPTGMQELLFNGKDDSGRVRIGTLILNVK